MFTEYLIQSALSGQRHPLCERATALAAQLAVHAAGASPATLLNTARPNEAEAYKAYRLVAYEPVTKSAFDKIHAQVAKLRRAQGLTLVLPESPPSGPLREGEGPAEYLTKDFPGHDHLFAWLFTYATRRLLADPNALCIVLPREGVSLPYPAETETNGAYLTPVPTIYPAGDVLDFVPGAFAAVILSRTVAYPLNGGGTASDGMKVLLLDKADFAILTQTGSKSAQGVIPYAHEAHPHGTAGLPAVLLGSSTIEVEADGRTVYESFLSPCLPHWNEATRRYSDHQVNMVLHLHPEKVMKMTTPCAAKGCQGGRVTGSDPDGGYFDTACSNCHGTGYISITSPFGVTYVPPIKAGGMGAVDVPAGELISYVQKPTNDLAFLKEEYRDKLADAFDAVGLGYLSAVPLNQSGRAKELDRTEINTFYGAIANHVVDAVLKPVIWYILAQRYSFITPKARADWYDAMTITVPDSFDVVGLDYYRERVKQSEESKVPALLAGAAAVEYAAKEYGKGALPTRLLSVQVALDPLPGLNAAEKTDLVLAQAASALDVRVSAALPALLRRAFDADDTFLEKTFAEQRTAVYLLARTDAAADAPAELAPAGGDPALPAGELTPAQKLKGTVGGVEGLLAIQQAVATGQTDRSAAIAMLIDIYGYDAAGAEKILGTPRVVTPPVA